MQIFLQVLQKESFIESVALLVITAVVANFLVPRIKAKIDQDAFEHQKIFEDTLARRTKLRDDRIKLLDEIETFLWEYQYLLLEPSYFVLRRNEVGFKQAFQRYDEKASLLLATISARISRLTRLAKIETCQTFRDLLHTKLIGLDSQLIRLAESDNSMSLETRAEWQQHHTQAYRELGEEIEVALLLLAQDFNLTRDQAESELSKKTKR